MIPVLPGIGSGTRSDTPPNTKKRGNPDPKTQNAGRQLNRGHKISEEMPEKIKRMKVCQKKGSKAVLHMGCIKLFDSDKTMV